MANPVFYQTQNNLGVDPTLYYTNLETAGGSVTPEYPAPPFIPGTRAFGSDGSEFLFVQASTAINLGDFIVITAYASSVGGATSPYTANSISTTNVVSSLAVEIGATGLVLKQSVTTIPAGAMFWACVKGQFIPAYTSYSAPGGLASAAGTSILYTTPSATAGALTTVQSTTTLAGAFAGFTVVSSLSTSIPASVVPPVGTLTSTGFAQGPIVSMNKPRTVSIVTSITGLTGTFESLQLGW